MTDVFVEQPEEELYSTLAPPEEGPDPVGEMFGAFGDIGEAAVDILGTSDVFRPRWPWDWGAYKDRFKTVGTTVADLVTGGGKFGPPEEVEDPTLEGLIEQKAQELLPAGDPKNLGATDGVLKALHFETMTGESAFVKFINWLGQNSVEVAARSGSPLGESLIYNEGPQGGRQIKPQMEGARVVGLRDQEGKKVLADYLNANWGDIEDLRELVQQKLAINWSEFTSAVVNGVRPADFGIREANPELFAEVMRQFGTFGDGTATLATVDDIYGGGSAVDIVGGVVAEAITEYAAELSRRQNTILIGPSIEMMDDPNTDGGPQISIGDVGFITSFDGTPYGDITSVNDLFSGGKIGPMDALPYMEALYANTKDSRGYSAIIERIQQELFAWGLLDPGDDLEWGKLDISGMHARADRTVDALQMFQADIINTALDVWEENPENLAPDASPYISDVTERLIARNVNAHDVQINGIRDHEEKILEAVSKRIQDRVAQSGGHRTINQRGIREVEATIREMINEMGSESRERYFGRGGGAAERQIVNSLMADFYQDSDWGSQIFFGGSNNDLDFMRYAKGVGALTDEQMSMLLQGQIAPEDFRSNWDRDDIRRLQAAEEDVITANLLKFIANYSTGDGVDANAMRRGLITFAHTIGQRTAAEHGYRDQDYARMVNKAIEESRYAPAESPLVSTLDDRLAESYDLVGGGGDTPDFRNLMSSLNQRRRGVNTLKVRNV